MRQPALLAAAFALVAGAAAAAPTDRPSPNIKVVGEFEVGSMARVVRPPQGRARWQVRAPGGWRALTSGPGRVVELPAAAAGRPVRAVVRRDGRWYPGVRRLVAPRVEIVGDVRVGAVARLRAPSTTVRSRWQMRPQPGARWRAISADERLALEGGLADTEIRAQARIHGRWWPSERATVAGEPGADPSRAVARPVVAGIGAVGTPLVAMPADGGPVPDERTIVWQRRTPGATWQPTDTESDAAIELSETDRGHELRACALVDGGVCSAPVGPITSGTTLGTQDDRLPVARPKRIGTRLDLIAKTGTSLSRVDLFWSDIADEEPADPSNAADPGYDWRRADAILAGLAARDLTPIVSVYSPPRWATGGLAPRDGRPVNPFAPDPAAFGEFIAALTQRYSGAYVPPGRSRPLPEVRFLEMWNEPNIPMFLRPQRAGGRLVALETYIRLARAGYRAAKSVNPGVNVLVGALGSGRTSRAFRNGLRRADVPLDAFSHHLYPRAGPLRRTRAYPSWNSLPELVGVLDAWKPGLPLFITEAGYSTEESSFRPSGSAVSERRQARYLSDIFRVPLVRSGRVSAVVWFNLQANDAWPTGLLRTDGTRKPSYRRFVELLRTSRE